MKTLGIRKETKNKWERRVPLNPDAVKKLVEDGYKVIVQPSEIRIYTDDEYEKVGAELNSDLSSADLILSVKEVHIPDVIPQIPHLFFSHTIKGQSYNMPMLKYFLDTKTTLLDYERIIDDKGRRLVFFGKFAGNAGAVDTLYGLGQRLKQQYNIDTPFLEIKQAYNYKSLADALEHLKEVGKKIEKEGLPDEITPLTIFILGYGHVSKGVQEVLNTLPVEYVDPDDLEKLQTNYKNNKIYVSVFMEKHLVERKDGSPFDLQDYFKHCENYKSKLGKYLPYCSVYMNAIYWEPKCPVFLSREEMIKLQGENQKLIIIGDITCDIDGSVQATVKATEPDNPIFIYNAKTGEITDGFKGEGFADCAVDNLPCEFSKEASDNFSNALMPFMEDMLNADFSKEIPESGLPKPIQRSCIAHKGKLQPDYEYLYDYLKNL